MRHYLKLSSILVTCCLLLSYVVPSYADYNSLFETYQSISPSIKKNDYGVPVYIESIGAEEAQQGDIYGIIYHPFNKVKQSLSQAVNWCDIAPQHLNIKACTYRKLNGSCQLRLYSGRKYFEYPEDTYVLEYLYSPEILQANFFNISLLAKDGPLGTSDYKIITQAIPLDDNSTFIHFSYSYKQGFWTRAAMGTYLATLGRDKIGFTIVDRDENDAPIYIAGVRGVIERNAIRYYYAIQSYLDTLNIDPEKRFLARLNHWYELTEKHHAQLYEMDKEKYLEYKQKEHVEQLRLQEIINREQETCIKQPDSDSK